MQECQQITRRSASNLALAFVLLPKARREAMSALYAFCRQVDDVADEDSAPEPQRAAALARWRADIRCACDGGTPEFVVNRELQPFIQQYRLPFNLFDELIQGCEMDLHTRRYADFGSLELYCYRVASVVGLLSIEIFGYRNVACRKYAVALGQALQLTNILRDVRTDAARGRIYLPQSELRHSGVTEAEVLGGDFTEHYQRLAEAVAERAKRFYRLARQTLPPEDRRSMIAAELMGAVYWQLLGKLERRRYDVFGPRLVRLGRPHKLWLMLRTGLKLRLGLASPNYGYT